MRVLMLAVLLAAASPATAESLLRADNSEMVGWPAYDGAGKLTFILTRGIDRCLALYPLDAWRPLAEKVAALPITDADARNFRRLVFAEAADLINQAYAWSQRAPRNINTRFPAFPGRWFRTGSRCRVGA